MWGETCRWAAVLSDPAFISVVCITVKIPWVQRLLQYLEGQWDYPSQSRILLYLTQFCIRHQVCYPSYGPWHRARAAPLPRQVLPQGAKTSARVFANIQNFALCVQCMHGIPHMGLHGLLLSPNYHKTAQGPPEVVGGHPEIMIV